MRSRLDSWAPARRRLAVTGGIAVLLVFAVLAAWGILRAVADPQGVDQSKPGPVLLVPGYGGNTASLEPLATELRRLGREPVVYEPTDNATGDLRKQARLLAELAERTMQRTEAQSVDVIGFSAGGVIARLYVREEGGDEQVRRVLTLGSPHHGSDTAQNAKDAAGGCPTACEQLVADSELLSRLNAGDETPEGPEWITLRSDADTIVTPVESASLEGALNLRIQDFCPPSRTPHDGLTSDAVTFAVLPKVLGKQPPAVPEMLSC